jgi:hypothetical protein
MVKYTLFNDQSHIYPDSYIPVVISSPVWLLQDGMTTEEMLVLI